MRLCTITTYRSRKNKIALVFSIATYGLHNTTHAMTPPFPTPVFDPARAEVHRETIEATIEQVTELERKIRKHQELLQTLERNAKKADEFLFSSIPFVSQLLREQRSMAAKSLARQLETIQSIHNSLNAPCTKTDTCSMNALQAIRKGLHSVNTLQREHSSMTLKQTEQSEESLDRDVEKLRNLEHANHLAQGEMAALDAANQHHAEEAAQLSKLRAAVLQIQESRSIDLEREALERENAQRRLDRFSGRPRKKSE